MRRNGVMDITAAGSSVIKVSRMTICIGRLSEAPSFPAEIPRRENGSPAAPMAGSARARPPRIRNSLTAQPPRRGRPSSPPTASPDPTSAHPAGGGGGRQPPGLTHPPPPPPPGGGRPTPPTPGRGGGEAAARGGLGGE